MVILQLNRLVPGENGWDKLMERIDKDLDDIQEALKEKEEKQAEEEYEDKIQKLFDERKELGPFKLVGGTSKGHPDENDLIDAVEFFRGLIRVGRAE